MITTGKRTRARCERIDHGSALAGRSKLNTDSRHTRCKCVQGVDFWMKDWRIWNPLKQGRSAGAFCCT